MAEWRTINHSLPWAGLLCLLWLSVLLCSCAAPSMSGSPEAEIDARVASPDLLTDKSKDETVVAPAPEIVQGEGSTADVDTSAAVADTSQKGLFNANMAIIGGGSAFGGLAGVALWLRWARKTSEARTNAQTERMKMLTDVIKAMIDRPNPQSK